jgi:hypothetical protein
MREYGAGDSDIYVRVEEKEREEDDCGGRLAGGE